jgi:hypothetical protein
VKPVETESDDAALAGGSFHHFVTRLTFQGLLALGVLENPLTRTRQKSRERATMVLDDLRMLREKTLGNLEPDEAAHLDKTIADLQAALEAL